MGRWILIALFLLMAALNAAGWIGARRGLLPRNAFFGIRTRQVLRSDEAWDAGQRSGWRVRVILPVLYLAGALWLALGGPHGFLYTHVIATVLVISAVNIFISAASVTAAQRSTANL